MKKRQRFRRALRPHLSPASALRRQAKVLLEVFVEKVVKQGALQSWNADWWCGEEDTVSRGFVSAVTSFDCCTLGHSSMPFLPGYASINDAFRFSFAAAAVLPAATLARSDEPRMLTQRHWTDVMPPGDLSSTYRRQFEWRSWSLAWNLLPPLAGRTVLDLGCGVGDQAAELARRGANVIGFDANPELLATARSRSIAGADFRAGDLRNLPPLAGNVDGIWCSFAAAYFPDLAPILRSWRTRLRPGGWIALTEVDDLFGHDPVQPRTRSMLQAFAHDSASAGRYDFHMGRRLADQLNVSGFCVEVATTLPDAELAFQGPAPPDIFDAWQARFSRLGRLRDFCGSDFDAVRAEFLAALSHPQHRSFTTVHFCIGEAPAEKI